jgi:hypothetical protein
MGRIGVGQGKGRDKMFSRSDRSSQLPCMIKADSSMNQRYASFSLHECFLQSDKKRAVALLFSKL